LGLTISLTLNLAREACDLQYNEVKGSIQKKKKKKQKQNSQN